MWLSQLHTLMIFLMKKLVNFLKDYCPIYQYDIEGLIENEIKTFEIKYNKTMKVPKFTMQLYSFIYDCLMDFPSTKFDEIKTVTTRGFLSKIYKILNAKVTCTILMYVEKYMAIHTIIATGNLEKTNNTCL